MKGKTAFYLLLLTAGALLVHGYHPWTEDAAFYVPPVRKLLDPALYPYASEFFQSHAALTFFPELIAGSVRVLHVRLETALLGWHLLTMYLFLVSCWQVSSLCFESDAARWCAVALEASLLTLPVAGTSLYLMDEYVNPRSFSTFAGMIAVACALKKHYVWAVFCLLAAGLIHPLMPVYGFAFLALLWWNQSGAVRARTDQAVAAALVFGFSLEPPTEAYHQAAAQHAFHYVTQWPWYGWLGILAPIAIFYWLARFAAAKQMVNVELLSRSLAALVILSLVTALILDIPRRFEALARLQPLRSLHLVYALLVLLVGGVAGQFVLKRSLARWLILFIPLCAGMGYSQYRLFSATAHIEWPGVESRNQWVQAFAWIRRNTPVDAYFALDPYYMDRPGEDEQSFRAISGRSMLADMVKDSGAAAMFPPLAEEWWDRMTALKGWSGFQRADLKQLQRRYGVNWVVVEQPGIAGLTCPYQNPGVQVCRID